MQKITDPLDDLPLPETRFRKAGVASRTTFFRWEQQGLRILHVGGRRFIRPSELNRFLESQSAKQISPPAK